MPPLLDELASWHFVDTDAEDGVEEPQGVIGLRSILHHAGPPPKDVDKDVNGNLSI